MTSPPLSRLSTSQPPGRSTREAELTASPRLATEETEETGAVGGEVEEEETTGDLALLRGTERMTGTGGDLHTGVGKITIILHAEEDVMMAGAGDHLVVGEEEVVTMEVEDTTMMTTVATMTTAGAATPVERTKKINFPTIWNISSPRTTLWLQGRCSSATWSST